MDYPIHDLVVRPLERSEHGAGEAMRLVGYSDHLLRRFGLAEWWRLPGDGERLPRLRPVADELWALVGGRVQFSWNDQRDDSPTRGQNFELDCDQPTLVLAPFGVLFGIRALGGPAELVRLATHEDNSANG